MLKDFAFLTLQGLVEKLPFRSLLAGMWSKGWFPGVLSITLTFGLPDGNSLMFRWPSQVKIVLDDVYSKASYDRFWNVQQGFKVLDVGAYIGVYTLKMAKKAGNQGRVISVEPEEENFRFLLRNIQINGFDNIIPLRAALSDFEGKKPLFLSAHGSGEHSLLPKSQIKTDVQVYTVDGLMRKLRIHLLDVMKIDAEGAEIQVLKGSNQMLKEHRIRRIAIASYHYPEESDQVVNFLTAFNYRVITDKSYVYALLREEYLTQQTI